MLKLRKKDRVRLESILAKLERGNSYLMRDDKLLCTKRNAPTTTLDFTNKAGECCVRETKEYGSLLCLLHTGIHDLRVALNETPDEIITEGN